MLSGTNQLHIISPFLMESFDIFFDEIKDMNLTHISLTTTLKDNNPDLFKKANSLHSFCRNCMLYQIDYKVHIDNKLHGKIYIVLKDGEPLRGIITSANFTETGLGQNHEWGVIIDDSVALKKLIIEVSSLSSHALSRDELEKIISRIDSYAREKMDEIKEPKFTLKISDIIKPRVEQSNSDKRFFLKPVGWLDNPFSISRTLSSDIEKLHFSKRKPVAVRVGDILICYAVGTAKLLGYFEVLEEPYYSEGELNRWPWEVKAKNICPKYSERWNAFQNTISSIQTSYKSDTPITYVGGKTLGALNFGADKIRLTEKFAHHVISIIDKAI